MTREFVKNFMVLRSLFVMMLEVSKAKPMSYEPVVPEIKLEVILIMKEVLSHSVANIIVFYGKVFKWDIENEMLQH